MTKFPEFILNKIIEEVKLGGYCESCSLKLIKKIEEWGTHGNVGRKMSDSDKEKISERMMNNKFMVGKCGPNHNSWTGGKIKHSKGYVLIYSPEHPFNRKNYVYEHRIVVEARIGRYLKPEEVVHHLNENKKDNRIENLMLFKNNAEHMKFHIKIRQVGMTGPIRRQIEHRWDEFI